MDDKMLGPFKVIEKRGSLYKLDLPNTIKVYPVFPVVLLFKDPITPYLDKSTNLLHLLISKANQNTK